MDYPFLLLSFAALVFAILFLFLNLGFSAVLFFISVGLLTVHNNTPEGKADIAKAQAEKLALVELKKSVEVRIRQLSSNPLDVASLEYILTTLDTFSKSDLKSLIGSAIIPLLKLKPLDERVRASVFSYTKKAIPKITSSNEISSKSLYEAALEILQQHPEQISLKQYALDVGRWHCSVSRPDGKVTIYDEQSIQNDIVVRSK